MTAPFRRPPGRALAIVVSVLVGLLVLVGGFVYFRFETADARNRALHDLDVTTRLKCGLLQQWRLERLGDGAVLQANPWLRDAVRRSGLGDAKALEQVRGWLASYAAYRQYDAVFLVAADGRVLTRRPDGSAPDLAVLRQLPGLIQARKVVLLDFYEDVQAGGPRLALAVPLALREPVGAVVLRIDPGYAVYPALAAWSGSMATAESLLVRREGDDVRLLSPTRKIPGLELRRSSPVTETGVLAVQGVTSGSDVVEGVNYERRKAVGVARRVPDSPWVVVSHVLQADLAATTFQHFTSVTAILGGLLFGAGAGVGLLWRGQAIRSFARQRVLLEKLQEKEEGLLRALTASRQVLFELDVGSWPWRGSVSPEEELARILGYPTEGFDGSLGAWMERLHPEDLALFQETVEAVGQGRLPSRQLELRQRSGSGDWCWLLIRGRRAEAAEGETRIVGSILDITHVKTADLARAASEDRLRLALRAARQGFFDVDLATGEADISQDFADMLGLDLTSHGEALARWEARVHPDDALRVLSGLQQVLAGAIPEIRDEYRLRREDGTWLWVLSTAQVVERAADGTPLRLVGIHTDIHARKLAQLRTERMSGLYAALSQANEAIVRCTGREQLFAAVVRAAVDHGGFALAWIGWPEPETRTLRPVSWHGRGEEYLQGIHISYIPGDEFSKGPTGTAFLQRRPVWVSDFQNAPALAPWAERARPYGWNTAAALPLFLGGEPVGVLTLYGETSDPFDEEGRALLLDLAADLGLALEHLRSEELRAAAEARLVASLHEKEALLKEVHHRVKNNLQVITSLVRLESKRSPDPLVRAVLGEMQSRVMSMALLHETLYQSGNFDAVDLAVYLGALAQQVFRSLAPTNGRIQLLTDVAPARLELEQAVPCGLLVNELLVNALKHGFPSEAAGHIQLEVENLEDGAIRVEVRDDGVGLPPDFEQRRKKSLGLQLVDDLTRQLRGRLVVGGGSGSRFTLIFTPRAVAREHERLKV